MGDDRNTDLTKSTAEEDVQKGHDTARRKWPILLLAALLAGIVLFSYLFFPFLPGRQYRKVDTLDKDLQISEKLLPAFQVEQEDEEVIQQLQKLQFIYDYLKDYYYRELSDAELIEAMYAGLLSEMDSPYTFYLDAEEYSAMQESMAGEYSGIGAQVSWQNGLFVISDVFDNSPAAKAGLRNGDQIISVDGKLVTEFIDVNTLAVAVRGEEGSVVTLEVFRPSEQKEYTFAVTRGKVQNANLKFEMLEEGIGYVRILEFNQGVSKNFIRALQELKRAGAATIIFDMRYNGGGYVSEVTSMLDYLLPKGTLAIARGRVDGEPFEEVWTSEQGFGVPQDWKYVILQNAYSASASELFAGCLRDWDKAILVGEQSFGKGVGSITYELTDGSALQITNFHYYLPKGDSVQDNGLEPDVAVTLPEELAALPLGQVPHEEDSQLQAALQQARALLGAKNK